MRAIVLAGISQLAVSSVAFADNAVTRANEAMGLAMIAACQSPSGNPFHESRAYAMANLAIHDSLNAIERKYQPYTYDKKAEAGRTAFVLPVEIGQVVIRSDVPPQIVRSALSDALM